MKLKDVMMLAKCGVLGVLVATGLTAFAASGISSSAPEVWFRFDDKSVSGYQQNEGTLGSAVSFVGSYSAKGLNKGGAAYVKTPGGYGVHSYSPWCSSISLGNEFTIGFRLKATSESNRILFCLGSLQKENEALMLTTKDGQNLQLVVVKGTEVLNDARIHVEDVTAFNTYVIRYVNGQVSVNVNGAAETCCSVSYNHTSSVFQLLGGYNKQTAMSGYYHGCGVVNNSTGTVTEPYTANVIDDFCIWTTRQISMDEIGQYAQGLIPASYYHMVEYVCADGTTTSRHIGEDGIITADTETIGDGKWYVVEKSVSRKMIRVVGSAHLILCDGVKLTVNDDKQPAIALTDDNELTIYGQTKGTGELVAIGHRAGIGGGYLFDSFYPPRRKCGKLTINGGTVTAQGGDQSAGIGGYASGKGGTVTINGGTVTATGCDGGCGIGGGSGSGGGTVTINGGTVKATGGGRGVGIGSGPSDLSTPAVIRINGGNVIASSISDAPVNGAGKVLHKVTLNAPDGGVSVFEGLGGYGLRDVVPVGGKYCFYLPDGGYEVSAGTAETSHGYYYFIVEGKDVACNLQQFGLKVNGVDVGNGSGSGWIYSDRILRLGNSEVPYVLSGISTFGDVQVQVASDCTVDLSDAIIYTQGRPAFVVDEGVTATLRMKGGVSHLAATNAVDEASVSAIEVKVNGTMNVEFAPGADSVQSAIYVFNFGDKPAIGGSGKVSLIGGHLCAWSDERAVADTCGFGIASESSDKMIAQAGKSWTGMRFVSGQNPDAPIIEVAPSCRVRLPIEIPGVKSCVVANAMEPIGPSETVNMTNVYRVMVLDDVTIDFTPSEGYEIVSGGRVFIPSIVGDVTFGSADIPAPDVRKKLTVTLPESLDGETYVVKEDGEEVEKVGGGGDSGVAVYPVRSGYDIEIVCTAQEGWRIVSETNVVTFANIQESRVLTAADLPHAWRVFTVNVPAMANVAHELSTDDARMTIVADWETSSYAIISNAEVTVAFRGVGNYRVTANGTKIWTLTGDVTFGETDGFPLPTVEGIPGTVAAPWTVGENVQAYTNVEGVLTITGTGEMDDFANAADVPWDPATVRSIAIGNEVTKIGVNTWSGMSGDVVVDGGLPLSRYAFVGEGFAASEEPSGSISPAEFERIDIVDGKAMLGVSVYTSDAITNQNWSVATNGVIEVPAPGKQGFFILKSKPSVPSDAPHSPITILE